MDHRSDNLQFCRHIHGFYQKSLFAVEEHLLRERDLVFFVLLALIAFFGNSTIPSFSYQPSGKISSPVNSSC